MEDFTLTELKNIARDEGLSGWSKFKKEALFDFLVASGVNVTKYKKPKKCMKKSKESVVIQALDENIEVVDQNWNVKTKKELCKNLSKRKKEDIVQQALEFNIDIKRPNGKPKTSKELLEDISLKLLIDQQVVIEETPPATDVDVSSSKCLKKKKKDVVTEALSLGINITHPNGKVKTVKELCTEIELIIPVVKGTVPEALAMGINISHPDGKVKTVKELAGEIKLQKSTSSSNVSVNTECIITDEGNEICINSQQYTSPEECVVTPNGDIACNDQKRETEEICVVTQACATDSGTGEETCAPVNVCASVHSVLVPPETGATKQIPSFDNRRNVDIQDIEKQLAEISNPVISYNQNIIGVKETVFKALGLI
jgi:hypothetical protein